MQAAINLQSEFIARGWPTSAEVGMAAKGSRTAVNPVMWSRDHRKTDTLIGCMVAPRIHLGHHTSSLTWLAA
jgi:hypothetical protein